MALFNENLVDISVFQESDIEKIGMILYGFLSSEEASQLQEYFRKCNEGKSANDINFYPFWKFCLSNINVSYKKKQKKGENK